MKRFAIILLASAALLFIPNKSKAQNHALREAEEIAGYSIDATRADNVYDARNRAAEGWDRLGSEAWKANRRANWEYRKAARNQARQQRRDARANRRRYHLRDYQPAQERRRTRR